MHQGLIHKVSTDDTSKAREYMNIFEMLVQKLFVRLTFHVARSNVLRQTDRQIVRKTDGQTDRHAMQAVAYWVAYQLLTWMSGWLSCRLAESPI